jgi:hypothetical protein
MIVYRQWRTDIPGRYSHSPRQDIVRSGWFLLGFIPLYIRDHDTRKAR